ncbi:hypothetical protein P3342_011673 [Pyrenophora teres f. teres]|nr:hypothetical protein P3342_011673 [Pyrenophora teres f. teres]
MPEVGESDFRLAEFSHRQKVFQVLRTLYVFHPTVVQAAVRIKRAILLWAISLCRIHLATPALAVFLIDSLDSGIRRSTWI